MYVQKKPMNTIEGPVQPFIRKDPPRAYKTKKHWVVHTDDIIRAQDDNTQLIDDYVLAVSRDENQTRYGKRSYIPKVNKEFRPPLIDPEYDLTPLSRLPRPRTSVRTNPDATGVAATQNIHGQDVSSMIDERKMYAAVRPTYTIAFEKPQEVVIPDLKLKMPSVDVSAKANTPMYFENDRSGDNLHLERKNPEVYGSASANAPLQLDQTTPLEDLILDYKVPQVSGQAGMNNPSKLDQTTPLEDLELNYNMPTVAGVSGAAHPYLQNQPSAAEDLQLNYTRPQTQVQTNPNAPTQVGDYQRMYNVRTQNPIQVSHMLTPNYGVSVDCRNENPNLRPTLQWNRSFGAMGNLPSNIQNQNPTLKPKASVRAQIPSVIM